MSNIAERIKEGIDQCIECETCMEEGVCPTYFATGDKLYSPLGRIYCLRKLLDVKKNCKKNEVLESLLTCTSCGRCTEVCPVDVAVGELVVEGRALLYEKGEIPAERQKRIIESLESNRNAVSRSGEDRAVRKDGFFKRFMEKRAKTLFYAGCIASFFNPESVKASLAVLEDLGIEFFMLEDEPCCGIFLYEGGYGDKASRYFRETVGMLRDLGVKDIIAMCASCYKCFSVYYKKLLGDLPFSIKHFVEVVNEELLKGKKLQGREGDYILHDPCKLSRHMGVVEAQRSILRMCNVEFSEFSQKGRMSLCCGAGSGVRAYKPELAMNVADRVLEEAGKRSIIALCPFCQFNFNYTSKKRGLGTRSIYISEVLWRKDI